MKHFICLLLFAFGSSMISQVMDPASLAMCRAQQCASELALFIKFSKSEDSRFECVVESFKKKERAFYEKGKLFRYFETSDDMLNGRYEIYYRSGALYLKATYRNNYPADSTQLFYESGKIKTRIKYKSASSFDVTYYYENGNIKKFISAEQPVECMDDSNLYNAEKSPAKKVFYNQNGIEISEQEFKVLNKNDE